MSPYEIKGLFSIQSLVARTFMLNPDASLEIRGFGIVAG